MYSPPAPPIPTPRSDPLPLKSKSIVPWIWYFVQPHRWQWIAFMTMRFIVEMGFIAGPFFVAMALDYVQSAEFAINPNKAFWILGIMIPLATVNYVLQYLSRSREVYLRERIRREVTFFGLQHLICLPLAWHESQGSGSNLQRLMLGRDAFFNILELFSFIFISIAGRVSIIIIIFILNAPIEFTGIIAIFGVSYYLLIRWTARPISEAHYLAMRYFEKMLGKIYEFAASIFTVKSLNLLPYIQHSSWQRETKHLKKIQYAYYFIYRRWFILNNFSNLVTRSVQLWALWLLVKGEITVGVFVLIVAYIGELWSTLEQLGTNHNRYIEAKSGFLRLIEMLRAKTEKLDYQPAQPFLTNWQELKINIKKFKYGQQIALRDLNLRIPRNQKVALVGKSGAGKSTFVKLLLKHVLPNSGSLSFDGVNLKNIPKQELLEHIAVVPQDTELFDISIKENVLIRAKHPRKFKQYLKMAHATEFVNELPKKENTLIGERGVKLSGGQKQRIGIARALAQEAEIIIFDEATSALDTESERAIQAAIREMFIGRTAFIIAHRLSTIQHVDRILVFKNGEIVEDGNFEQLVKKRGGHLSKLWKLQKLD